MMEKRRGNEKTYKSLINPNIKRSKMKTKIYVILMISVLLISAMAGCVSNKRDYMSGEDITKNLKVTIGLEKTTFNKGEEITIPIIFTNNGAQPIMVKSADIIIKISLPEGSPATNNISLEAIHNYLGTPIDPGKSLTEKIIWDQNYTIGSKDYNAISGIYNLKTSVKLETRTVPTSMSVSNFDIDPSSITIN